MTARKAEAISSSFADSYFRQRRTFPSAAKAERSRLVSTRKEQEHAQVPVSRMASDTSLMKYIDVIVPELTPLANRWSRVLSRQSQMLVGRDGLSAEEFRRRLDRIACAPNRVVLVRDGDVVFIRVKGHLHGPAVVRELADLVVPWVLRCKRTVSQLLISEGLVKWHSLIVFLPLRTRI